MPKPALRITLDGRDLTDRLRPLFSTLTLTETRDSDADELELVLSDHQGRTPLPPKGAVIALQLGFEGKPLVNKGLFRIDQRALSGPPDIMTLKAKSADFTSELTVRRDGAWRDTTIGAVLGELASRQGLQAAIAPELAGVGVTLLEQSRESDSALLRRLGQRHDAVATIKAGRLIFSPIGKGATARGRALATFQIHRRDGDIFTWEEADRDKHAGVTARWHDVAGASTRTVEVGGTGSGRKKRLRKTYGSEADARAAAAAEAARLARGEASFKYTLAEARAELFPEQKGRLFGFAHPEITAPTWLIARAQHTWTEEVFTTALDLETAAS